MTVKCQHELAKTTILAWTLRDGKLTNRIGHFNNIGAMGKAVVLIIIVYSATGHKFRNFQVSPTEIREILSTFHAQQVSSCGRKCL